MNDSRSWSRSRRLERSDKIPEEIVRMYRVAFTMKLKPGALAAYKKQHDEIWPELVEKIEQEGIAHISTFEADPLLFLFSEVRDQDAWTRLWNSEIHQRWSEVMSQFMYVGDDGIVESSTVNEIFHLETGAK